MRIRIRNISVMIWMEIRMMVEMFKGNMWRVRIRVNEIWMLVSMWIELLGIVEERMWEIWIERRNERWMLVRNNVMSVKWRCINGWMRREFNGVIR